MKMRDMVYSVPGNLLLITVGTLVFTYGLKAIAIPHGFISGGITGVSLLCYYASGLMTPGIWYFLINVPIFAVGWFFVGKRFFLYSIYGMLCFSVVVDLINVQFPIREPMLAAFAAGGIIGGGAGIILHSVGSAGGGDIIAVILNQRFNVRMGTFFFAFNLVLFGASFAFLDNDIVLYSLLLSFVSSQVIDTVLTLFNQRKIVFVISDSSESIGTEVNKTLHRGGTILYGKGTYSGKNKRILMTVVNNFELKRLEELVYGIDPEAFVIIERTFNVLGKGFSQRKIYS
ncbi:MAG: YitT family protein [Desulfobacterales bacterium]